MNVRSTIILLSLAATVVSCSSLKHAAKYKQPTQDETLVYHFSKQATYTKPEQVIAETPVKVSQSNKTSITNHNKVIQAATAHLTKYTTPTPQSIAVVNAEALQLKQIKYAILLDVPAEELTNIELYNFLDEWYGVRYRFGGTSKKGVDCSSLMQHIYTNVYGKELPRTAITQYQSTQRIVKEELQEGDLIFFHTTRSGISHVGMYIGNNRFVHASCSKGVTISNLTESYYANAYRGSGRHISKAEATALSK